MGLGAPSEGVEGFSGEGNLCCCHLQREHQVKHCVQLWTWSRLQGARATRCRDLEAEVSLLMLKPLWPRGMRSQQLCAEETASLVQSFSPGTTSQLAGMVLGTMKIPFHRAGDGKDTLHSGCEAETDP